MLENTAGVVNAYAEMQDAVEGGVVRIYTRTGDGGDTSLYTPKGAATRVRKSDARVQAYGTVDELNATIGLIRAELATDDELQPLLREVQNRLFHVGYDLSTLPKDGGVATTVIAANTREIERWIDRYTEKAPPLKQFVLPSGGRIGAWLHVARTVARRAERQVVHLRQDHAINDEALRYLNRLSDLLFALARYVNWRDGHGEEPVSWHVDG